MHFFNFRRISAINLLNLNIKSHTPIIYNDGFNTQSMRVKYRFIFFYLHPKKLKIFRISKKKVQELLILETCDRFPWLGGCTSQEDGGECRRIHSSSLSISRRPLTPVRSIVNTQFTLLRSASSSVVLVTRSNFSCKIRIPNVGTELMNWSAWYCIRVSTCKTMTSQNQTSDVITRDRIQVPLISSKQLSFIWRCIILKFSIFLLKSL